MEATASFILKSGVGLLVLYLFYYALLRHENSFRFNRLYLLLAPLAALVFPLVSWPSLLFPEADMLHTLQTIQLNAITITAAKQPIHGIPLAPAKLLLGLYLLVTFLLALKLARQLLQIRLLKRKATSMEHDVAGARVVQLPRGHTSFAFLNTVFLGTHEQLSATEKQQVLTHELSHVRLGHTYDILFYELLSVAWWFNPLLWLLKKELRNVHEFQADAHVLKHYQPQAYRTLLSKEVLFNMGLPVGSHFQKPQVLQRLHMLQKNGQKSGWLKPLLSLPLFALLLVSLSSQQLASPNAAALPPASNGKVPKNGTAIKQGARSPQERPYTYVELMPQFEGGEQAMMQFLGTHIRYPTAAKEAGLSGLVVISFIVQPDGHLEEVEVLKKLGQGTDEEALRVVQLMEGKWAPGKQNGKAVPVRYTLPIRFEMN
ncbi:TonB family protein [Pontibacter sp. CAU 1760]